MSTNLANQIRRTCEDDVNGIVHVNISEQVRSNILRRISTIPFSGAKFRYSISKCLG